MKVSNQPMVLASATSWLLAMFVALLIVQPVAAQQFMMAGDGNQEDMMKQQFRESLKQAEKSAEIRIASRIADMDRACQLSDSQKAKFRIASKGAIKATVNETKKQLAQTAKQMNMDFDPFEEEEEEPESDEDEGENEVQGRAGVMAANIAFFGGGMTGQNSNVENQKIWKNAIKTVLTEEQSKKWQDWLANRNQFQQQTAVNNFVARADRKLLLSSEQREQLAKYLNDEYGEKLRKQSESNDGNGMGINAFFLAARLNGQLAGEPEDEKDSPVAKILSGSQLEEWNRTFESQLQQLDNQVMGMGMPAVNIMPAGGNIVIEGQALDIEEIEDLDDDN